MGWMMGWIGSKAKISFYFNTTWRTLPPPFQSLSGHHVRATVRHERLEQPGLRSHDPNFALGDLDALCERAKMVAAVTAPFKPDTLARGVGELAEHLRRDRLAP